MNEKEFTDIQVFLVEPSHTQQQIIKHFLLEFGISDITTIETGREALELLKEKTPDLIMSSMYLLDMTGADLVENLRSSSNSANTAFILISSETKIQHLEPIRQAGTIAILPKPFTSKELDSALSATLDYLNPQQLELEHLDTEDISVLVVDDSSFSRKYISKILNDIGIDQISLAENGKVALDLVNDHYFDFVITDYNMPEMDGLELTMSIRNESSQKTIPIIMVTSEKNTSRLTAVKQAGFAAILDKPFEPKLIRKMIIQLLN